MKAGFAVYNIERRETTTRVPARWCGNFRRKGRPLRFNWKTARLGIKGALGDSKEEENGCIEKACENRPFVQAYASAAKENMSRLPKAVFTRIVGAYGGPEPHRGAACRWRS